MGIWLEKLNMHSYEPSEDTPVDKTLEDGEKDLNYGDDDDGEEDDEKDVDANAKSPTKGAKMFNDEKVEDLAVTDAKESEIEKGNNEKTVDLRSNKV